MNKSMEEKGFKMNTNNLTKSSLVQQKQPMSDDKDKVLKEQEKDLQKKIQAYVEVAKHKLGRTPTLEEVMRLLGDHQGTQELSKDSQVSDESGFVTSEPKKTSAAPTSGEVPEPDILHMTVYYGNSVDKDTKQKKPDLNKILYYKTKDGRVYNCLTKEWETEAPQVLDHLPSRPIHANETDVVAAIANGVMTEHDYESLDTAGLIGETPKKLWALISMLEQQMNENEEEEATPHPEEEEATPHPEEGLEKSHEFEEELSLDPLDSYGGEWPVPDLESTEDGSYSLTGEFTDSGELQEPGEDLVSQIVERAMGRALNDSDSLIRQIVREEISNYFNNTSDEVVSEMNSINNPFTR